MLRPPVELSQYTSLAYSQKLLDHGVSGSIGRVGTAYDNALMESTIGLYKTELIHARQTGWMGRQEVETATTRWVTWFNQRRLHSALDYQSPSMSRRHTLTNSTCRGRLRENRASTKPRAVHTPLTSLSSQFTRLRSPSLPPLPSFLFVLPSSFRFSFSSLMAVPSQDQLRGGRAERAHEAHHDDHVEGRGEARVEPDAAEDE